MIEKIMYVNLDRRPDRKEWFLSNMKSVGVPMEIVERVPATDWRDYPDCLSILRAMQAEGFALNVQDSHAEAWQRGAYGLHFTLCRCLRRIIDERTRTLIMHDDVALNMEWDELLEKLSVLPDHEFYSCVVQLDWSYHRRANVCAPYEKGSDENWTWSYGIRGIGELAVIYSRFGADRVLAGLQGGMEMYPVESLLPDSCNNYRSFHPNKPQDFIRHAEGFGSDLDSRRVPDMLKAAEI